MSTASATRVPLSPVRPDFRAMDELVHLVATNGAVAALAPYGSNRVDRARSERADARRFNEAMGAIFAAGDLAAYSEYAQWEKARRAAL